jgi:hypothetical protein
MNRSDRMKLIQEIEEERKSKLIAYITGDRRGLETKISTDVFPMFHRHLTKSGQQEKIDLFLYSTGGMTIAGYALVNLIREFCERFGVIIPFKALSCATLISLGADEIVMTKMGQLSPIDPSVHHPLAPVVQLPGKPPQLAPVNVEDVSAFIELAEKEVHLTEEDSMKKVLEILASKVNPLVLGAVQRSREQIAFLASTLMKYHTQDQERIEKTVETLTRERFSHDYIFSRREAQEVLGLKIVQPAERLTDHIIGMFDAYNQIIMMDKPHNPEAVLGEDDVRIAEFNRAMIDSVDLTHVFRTKREIKRVSVTQPGMPRPVVGCQERVLQEEWIEDNNL